MTRGILVYYPEARDARAYADLIRLPSRAFSVHVASTPDEAVGPAAEAEIFYCWGLPRPLLAQAKRLRWIQCMGAGVERLLVPELPSHVRVTRAAGIFGPWMAEYTVGWCLWVTQRMKGFQASQRARRWEPVDPIPLRGQTLCVVGLGNIGRHVARAGGALGMHVIGVSRSGGVSRSRGVTRSGRGPREAERIYRTGALRSALARADFVVLTLPLSDATRGLLGAAELAALKTSAWLVNIARGPIVDEAALLDALRTGRLGGAILDVFDTEPLPPDHPFWDMENVVVTPHISGPSSPREIGPIFADNLRRYIAGRPLRHQVNRSRGY